MPVILPTLPALETWLGLPSGTSDSPASLLRPYDDPLAFYRVPTEVGKTGTDDGKFLLPIAARKDGIEAAFGRAKRAREGSAEQEEGKGKKPKREEGVGDSNAPIDARTEKKQVGSQEDEVDEEALVQATKQIEEEMEMDKAARQVEVAAARGEADQLEADRKLAEQMQREWEEEERKAAKQAKDAHAAADAGAAEGAVASSKFSPEPFNPPYSPPSKPGSSSNTNNKAGAGGATKLEQMLETQKKKAAKAPPKSSPATPNKGNDKTPESSGGAGKKKGDIRAFFSPAS